jgi:hypothetical protein
LKKSGLFMMTIVLFGIMLLASQIYNYLYIKELNRNYREIITTKTLELQSLEIITREASDIQHALLQIALNSKDIERWKKEVSSSGTNIDSQYSHLEKLMTAPKENKSIVRLKKMYMVYKESYASTLTLLIANRSGYKMAAAYIEKLKPVYEGYFDEQEKQTEFFRSGAEVLSDKLTIKTKKVSTLMLFIGTLPYLLLVSVFIIAFVVILWLGNIVNWFRIQE